MSEIAELIGGEDWLDPAADAVGDGLQAVFTGDAGRALKDGLNGTWLGHPLHPVLTDIPIGAWTMAQVFDSIDALAGGRRYEGAARVCITTGLVGAVGAAVTGLTDWSDTSGPARRIGLVHGLVNITATALFLTSIGVRSLTVTGHSTARLVRAVQGTER